MNKINTHIKVEKLQMNIVDFYSLLFLNTQNSKIDYIDLRSFETLLGSSTILLIGVLYISNHIFSLKEKRLYFVIIRYGSLKNFLFKMQSVALKKSLYYVFILNVVLISVCYFSNLGSYSSYLDNPNHSIFIILYFFVLVLVIFSISRIIIYIYIIKGSSLSIILAIIIPIIFTMLDISIKKINFLLFDYNHFFIDSLIFIVASNLGISLIGQRLIAKYKLHF